MLPARLDAAVLAAAPNRGPLEQSSPEPYEALIPVADRPIVGWVVEALASASRVHRILVVAPEPVVEAARQALAPAGRAGGQAAAERLVGVEPAGSLLANMERGLRHARGSHALLVTGDVPLLRPEMVDDFVARCEAHGEACDVFYAIVERSAGEQRYPGLRRTWVRMADGVFTGGNLAVVQRGVVARARPMLELAIAARKSPLALARLFGLGTLWRFVRGRLTVAEMEARVGRMLGIRGRAVVTPHVEIGIDVDQPADLALARRHLARAGATG